MNFSMVLNNAVFFKRLINALTVVEEPIFNVNSDGLFVRQMDVSKVCMVELELPSSTFVDFDCDEPQYFKISKEDLLDSLRRAREDQYIGFTIGEETQGKLMLTLSEKAIKDFTMSTFTLDDGESALIKPPKRIDYESKIKIDTSAVLDTMSDLKSILAKDAVVNVKTGKDCLVISGKGEKRGLTVTHQLGADILAMDTPDKCSDANYGVVYMSEIVINPSALSGVVVLEFSTDFPIKLTYELPFEGNLRYYLAPRLDVEGVKR